MTYFFSYVVPLINEIQSRNRQKAAPPFPNGGNIRITKNFSGITLTSTVAKVYNGLLLNHIKSEIEKILMKNQNGFHRN